MADSATAPERGRLEPYEALLHWRLDRQTDFETCNRQFPKVFPRKVCNEFVKRTPEQAVLLAVACSPEFIIGAVGPLQETVSGSALSYLKRYEPWREVQYRMFISDSRFRTRYLQLAVWESNTLGHWQPISPHRELQLVGCHFLRKQIHACSAAYAGKAGYSELPHTANLHAVLLFALTSRFDLIKSIKAGNIEVSQAFTEWNDWFEAEKKNMVQRRDLLGWVVTDPEAVSDPSAPHVAIRFPKLLLPDRPMASLPVVEHAMRVPFSYR